MKRHLHNLGLCPRQLAKHPCSGGNRCGWKRPQALVPHTKGGIVIVRIPVGTPPAEASKATTWARNMAAKINKSHEKDHYYEKGW